MDFCSVAGLYASFCSHLGYLLSAGAGVSIETDGSGDFSLVFVDTGDYNVFVSWFQAKIVGDAGDSDACSWVFDPSKRLVAVSWFI